jgi:hypothetical protein
VQSQNSVDIQQGPCWPGAVGGNTVISISLHPDYNMAVEPGADDNGSIGQFHITINPPIPSALNLVYQISGNATGGVDYSNLPGTLTIAANASSTNIPIYPLRDSPGGTDQSVILNLVLTNGYLVDPDHFTATMKIYEQRPSGMAVAILDSGWTKLNGLSATNWNYFVMPESIKEALRSDGTPFTVLSDLDIANGLLLNTNGTPKYPILIALACESIRDDEIAPLANYVASGGFILTGSSSFTRATNGTYRTNFALASQMGLTCSPSAANWYENTYLLKLTNHVLVNDLPDGSLTWKMPTSAEEISWGSCTDNHDYNAPHPVWSVAATTAITLARGDYCDPAPTCPRPFLTINQYGSGYFMYHAAMQPLIGHGGFAPSMYAYMLMRRAIEWAYQSQNLPVVKVSPWPFQYDAAFIVRHDLENFTNEFAHVNESALYEQQHGAKGDYYPCTGAAFGDTNIVAVMREATNYGATIGPHNGGLPNPRLTLDTNSTCFALPNQYIYFHWGPDEALDTPFGYEYALASLSNAFHDVDTWLGTQSPRLWCAPYFNATREDCYRMQEQLNVKITGDQKLTPFPAFTLSTQTDGKRYGILSEPVSDWFTFQSDFPAGLVAQSLEPWHPPGVHTPQTLQAGVNFYYTNGFLINFYSHTLSASSDNPGPAGLLVPQYIDYCTDSNTYPRMWSANAVNIYNWWLNRAVAQVTAIPGKANGNSAVTINVTGAQDPSAAVELVVPGSGIAVPLQVLTNSAAAGTNVYRVFEHSIKVLVGTVVTNVQVQYTNILVPIARDDFYSTTQGYPLLVSAPGVLANDFSGNWTNLIATNASNSQHGTLVLNTNGGFAYTPQSSFAGMDCFTYHATDGTNNFGSAMVTIQVTQTNGLFNDDFTRCDGRLSPWQVNPGGWAISGNTLQGTAAQYAFSYLDRIWTNANYSVQASINVQPTPWGGGLGGRLNPATGAHYAAWVYPEGSQGGSKVLKLVKFWDWSDWGYGGSSGTPMAQVALSGTVTNTWHTLKLSFQGTQIQVFYDSQAVINMTDTDSDASHPPTDYLSGGITLGVYEAALSSTNVIVTP